MAVRRSYSNYQLKDQITTARAMGRKMNMIHKINMIMWAQMELRAVVFNLYI